jgi:hypothetical protein
MVIINTMPELEKETDDFGTKKKIHQTNIGALPKTMFSGVHDWKSRSPNWTGYRYMHQNILSPT